MSNKRVDIIIIGAMKCGTTTLADLLSKHPEVCFCSNKEPDFFSKEPEWRIKLDEYHALYDQPEKIWAEASTSYSFYPHFSKKIWKDLREYNPELKLIYMYRDPVQRCVSHYMHVFERGYIEGSLQDAIRGVPLIVNNSRYAMQVKPFIETFGKSQVMLMDLAELAGKREKALDRLAGFTGLTRGNFPTDSGSHKNSSLTQDKHHHKYDEPNSFVKGIMSVTPKNLKKGVWNTLTGTGKRGFEAKPELSQEWREAIVRLLESDVREFERIVDRDLGHWLTF